MLVGTFHGFGVVHASCSSERKYHYFYIKNLIECTKVRVVRIGDNKYI
jgi:hypothetical protein